MGILNITPDSFSDGGRWSDKDQALCHALEMVQAGADIIDIGGESTRPGAREVPVQQELDRVLPLVESVAAETDVLISVDTSKAAVMSAAVEAGAGMINDVCALRQENALETASGLAVPVCIMHMRGMPRDMQKKPEYVDVVQEVLDFLLQRASDCQKAGIPAGQIFIDPGFGFGKSRQHNIDLFLALPRFVDSSYPVLVGVSRKSMLGQITGKAVDQRLAASITGAVLAAQAGAAIVRVHDVAETRDALKIVNELQFDRDSARQDG
jgi:dihydropteroate synthase